MSPASLPKPRTRVLGLDPGSRALGYAVVDLQGRGRFQYRECGILVAPARAEMPARLAKIGRELRGVIQEFQPHVTAVEDVFHQRNWRSALTLGQARGVVLFLAAEHGLTIASYPPATVKQTICGSGRAPKEQVQRMVAALARLTHPPAPDAADALAVAICHCLHQRGTP